MYNLAQLEEVVKVTVEEIAFSGCIQLYQHDRLLLEVSAEWRNRAEQLPNERHTRFGIASGCKIFTAVAICQLIEQGRLTADMRLRDCLSIPFLHFDPEITLHHLLTHTSGIPDYFDEDVMDDFEELWKDHPVYRMRSLQDFVPLFADQQMKFPPGKQFHYNNAGFIVLGLVVEQQSGMDFTEYVQKYIFDACGMDESGYFAADRLPSNTAIGYIYDEVGSWRTNIFSVPVRGGADGGAYTNGPDMHKFWQALIAHQLIGKEMTERLLSAHAHCNDDEDYYGYGIWMTRRKTKPFKFHLMGYDPGVSFNSSVYEEDGMILIITSNEDQGPYIITEAIESVLYPLHTTEID